MKTKVIVSILLITLLLFIVLTVLVITENTTIQSFNEAVYIPVSLIITPALTTTAAWIGRLTHWYTYAPIIVLLLIMPGTRIKIGLPIAITLSASAILGPIILKNIFAIERPSVNQLIEPGGFGYPSGHSMNAIVFFGMCVILILRYSKSKVLKIVFTVFAVTATISVGLSRIYLGVHTATDVLGGYLIGSVVICIAVLIEKRFTKETH